MIESRELLRKGGRALSPPLMSPPLIAADCVDRGSTVLCVFSLFSSPELLGKGRGCPVPVEDSTEAAEWNGFEFLRGAQKVREERGNGAGRGQHAHLHGGCASGEKAGEPEVGRSHAICSSSRKRD